MAVGRISGPLLKEDLIRNGIDLAFETDLLYLDVNNQRIGVRTSSPSHELQVNGTTRTSILNVDNSADIAEVNITGNTISTSNSTLNLGTLGNVVYQNRARIDSVDIEGNTISTNSSNANLELKPNGTGSVEVLSDLNVTGNIFATGNITAEGNITIGDEDTDSITINAEIASDLIPDQDDTYKLGSESKRFADINVNNLFANAVNSTDLTVDGVDLNLRQGNIFYVAENGSDDNTGTHPQDPVASIKYALSEATSGDTVFVYPGEYTEEFPLTVPVGVTLQGHSIRSVNISPTEQTEYNDAIIVNGESTVIDLTLKDFYSGGNYFDITANSSGSMTMNIGATEEAHTYVSGGTVSALGVTNATITNATYDHTTGELVITHTGGTTTNGTRAFIEGLVFSCSGGTKTYPNNGYGFRFATDFKVSTRSPYIKNITVITQGKTTTAEDPRGFNSGDAGKGAYIDGSYATTDSKEASMLFHSATFITPGVDAIVATNGVRIEWLNSFTYFANRSIHAFDSPKGKYSQGKTRIRLGGITGTFTPGNTITFTSADSSTVVTATIDSVDNDVIIVDGKFDDLEGFDLTPQSISDGSATATEILNYDRREFGAEIRLIGSASVYGNQGLVGTGAGVIMYAIGHNLAYIGNGKEVTNDPGTVIQVNEVVATDGAQIRFSSVDHKGDFRVGDLFYVNQETGSVEFVASELNINITDGVTFNTEGDITFVNGQRIDTGNLRFSGNTISSTAGNIEINAFNDIINLNNDVDITGDLDVTGNVTVGGNITLGDETTDGIDFQADVVSDIIPGSTSTYTLGSPSNIWHNLYVDEVDVDDITINTNVIQTTTSNADLELRASGTGSVRIPENNLQVDQNLTVSNLTTLANTNITGTLTLVGDYSQTGDLTVDGNVEVTRNLTVGAAAQFENILIQNNFITTTDSNSDLELRANGTGQVIIPTNDVTITQDLTVDGDITTTDVTSTGIVTAGEFNTGDIKIYDNIIETTLSNSDLELRANGTGGVIIDTFEFNTNEISTTGDLELSASTGIINIEASSAIKIPVGDTSERPTPTAGQIRYNTDTSKFEGYNGTAWIVLHGVEDADGDTRITPELTPGADDDTIRFYIANSLVATLTADTFEVPKLITTGLEIDDNTITTLDTNADLTLSGNGTGSVAIDNLSFNGSTITNTLSDSVTTFQNTGTGYVQFSGTNGFVIPVGDNTNKPAILEVGMVRFNTADDRVEIWNGSLWQSVSGSSGGISIVDAEDIAVKTALYLG